MNRKSKMQIFFGLFFVLSFFVLSGSGFCGKGSGQGGSVVTKSSPPKKPVTTVRQEKELSEEDIKAIHDLVDFGPQKGWKFWVQVNKDHYKILKRPHKKAGSEEDVKEETPLQFSLEHFDHSKRKKTFESLYADMDKADCFFQKKQEKKAQGLSQWPISDTFRHLMQNSKRFGKKKIVLEKKEHKKILDQALKKLDTLCAGKKQTTSGIPYSDTRFVGGVQGFKEKYKENRGLTKGDLSAHMENAGAPVWEMYKEWHKEEFPGTFFSDSTANKVGIIGGISGIFLGIFGTARTEQHQQKMQTMAEEKGVGIVDFDTIPAAE